jgi:hypothetical protein
MDVSDDDCYEWDAPAAAVGDEDDVGVGQLDADLTAELEAARDRGVDRDQVLAVLGEVARPGDPGYELDPVIAAVRGRNLGRARARRDRPPRDNPGPGASP